MKKKFLILMLVVTVLFTTACGKQDVKLKDGKEVVASIKGQDFTAEDLFEKMKESYGYDTLLDMIDTYIANEEIEDSDEIDDYVNQAIAYYTAYAQMYQMELMDFVKGYMGINANSEDELKDLIKADYKKTLAVEKQIGKEFSDKEVKSYYEKNYSEKLTVRHILIEIEDSDKDGSKALKTANEIIGKLKGVEKDKLEEKFSELAKEYSDDSSYSNGGLIEDFMESTVVDEFWKASTKLKDGEYTTSAVKTQYGYHIIYRVSKKDKDKLEDVEDKIRLALAEEKIQDDEMSYYTAAVELRKKYKLDIKDKSISEKYNEFRDSLKGNEETNKIGG